MKTFDHEWILEASAGRSTFFTKRMFGGLAAYLHERLILVLVEPTKTGRWKWHGVLVGTEHEHHASLRADFPALAPHDFVRKWLYVDSAHADFESTMEAVARCMAGNDRRFGVVPRAHLLHRPAKSRIAPTGEVRIAPTSVRRIAPWDNARALLSSEVFQHATDRQRQNPDIRKRSGDAAALVSP